MVYSPLPFSHSNVRRSSISSNKMTSSWNQPTKLHHLLRTMPVGTLLRFFLVGIGFLYCVALFTRVTLKKQEIRKYKALEWRVPIIISAADPDSTIEEPYQPRINPHPFSCPIREDRLCDQSDPTIPLVIACVLSSPGGFEYRRAIRATWGNTSQWGNVQGLASSADMRILFVIGSTTNSTLMTMIKEESDQYHDIMQCDYIDSYRNLSYKDVTWLKWVSRKCPHAYQVMKVDEDVFINPFVLVPMLRNLYDHGVAFRRTFTCKYWTGAKVFRKKTQKYYVSFEEYPNDTYPIFCSGPSYLMSTDLASLLYEKSLDTKFFRLEDVYITGILADQMENVIFQDIDIRGVFQLKYLKDYREYKEKALYVHLEGRFEMQYTMWKEIFTLFTNTSFAWPKAARVVPNVSKVV